MQKKKYLHRRKGDKNESKLYTNNKFRRNNNVDVFSYLPNRESIRQYRRCYSYFDYKPLTEFLMSKIGCDWNDIYSELLKKVKSNYRYEIDIYLDDICKNVIYDIDFIPRNSHGRILSDRLFVDMNNILSFKSKEELIIDSNRLIRQNKLKNIIMKLETDFENQFSD